MELEVLNKSDLRKLIGKTILWYSSQYSGNSDDLAVERIISIDESKRKPVIETEVICGISSSDTLKYAFNDDDDYCEPDTLCMGDSDRCILYMVINYPH